MARRWRGVVTVEGKPTGDGRFVLPGAIRWETEYMPYPLTWNRLGGGHDDRVVVGSIDTLERDGSLIRGSGVLLDGVVPEADDVIPLIERKLLGMSMELDDEKSFMQPIDADGNPVGDPEEGLGGIMIGAAPPPPPPKTAPKAPAVAPADAPPECPEGQHLDPDTGECVDDEMPADMPAPPPAKQPAKQQLGEPVDLQYRVEDGRIRNAAIVDTPAFIECTIDLVGDAEPAAVAAAITAGLRFSERLREEERVAHADAGVTIPDAAPVPVPAHHGENGAVELDTVTAVLHGLHGRTVPDVDVADVYAHLAAHLRAAGTEPPELSAILTGADCPQCAKGRLCAAVRIYDVPEGAATEARRFLGWRRAGRTGGTAAAASRATSLARSEAMTYAAVRRLYLALARLEAHSSDVGWEAGDPGYPTPGRVSWAANGGAPAWDWARLIVEGLEGSVLTYAALTAGAGGKAPPAAWFRDPQLAGPTPWTVTDEGRVFGHLALWDTCHISVTGECITPPHSSPGYPNFHQGGPFRLDDGSMIRAGKITFGTNHAERRLSAESTVEHYENTGHVGADVVAGEDRFGIWVAGALRSGLSEDERVALQRSSVSGDWRAPAGRYELMAALAVNNPGFPVVESLVAGGRPVSLVIAGLVEADLEARSRTVSGHDPRLEAAAEAIAATIGRDRPSLVAAMSAEVHGGL